ncbi:MAG: glycosyltransferase [Acidobacteriota bacterium]
METSLWILFALTLLSLLEAVCSLQGGFRFRELFRRHSGRPVADFQPAAALIVPCRGLDPGFRDNLRAFFEQDYPEFHLILITGDPDDPCAQPLQELRQDFPAVSSQLLFAGAAAGRSQKVHNLLCALTALRPRDKVLAFGDSDIRPGSHWLRHLVGTLQDSNAGMATGFRWYVPQKGNPASVLRAVWNVGIASLLSEKDSLFAWGGAMAIRRSVFRKCRIPDAWKGALSDDYAISRALRQRGRSGHFQPHCLSLSLEDCQFKELFSWSYRQLAITRVYHPSLWKAALATQLVNSLSLWGGFAILTLGVPAGLTLPVPAFLWGSMVAAIYLLGCWKAGLRLQAASLIHPGLGKRHRLAFLTLGPVASLITLLALMRSMFSRTIEWRGIRYRMDSPGKTEVLE